MARRLPPKQQGDLGEADAIAVLTRVGGEVSVPLFSSPHYDLVVDFGAGLQRVQVKTSTSARRTNPGIYSVALSTSGGNQSWNRTIRVFDRSRCDLLYALVGSGRRWLIPAEAVDGRRAINLGGPKYGEFELDADISSAGLEPLECAPLRGAPE